MHDTFDIGPLFAHPILLRSGTPFLHTAPTQEIDPPFRKSTSLVIRYWRRRGLVIGLWRKTGYNEDEALLEGLGGRESDFERAIAWNEENYAEDYVD